MSRPPPQRSHTARVIVPWSSRRLRLPARWWSPSTFCVTTIDRGKRVSSRAMASMGGVGRGLGRPADSARRTTARPSAGSARNASGVASSSGRIRSQRPPAPRKVSRPLSARDPGAGEDHDPLGRPHPLADRLGKLRGLHPPPSSRLTPARRILLQTRAHALPAQQLRPPRPRGERLRDEPRRRPPRPLRAHDLLRQGDDLAGPAAILRASQAMELYDEELGGRALPSRASRPCRRSSPRRSTWGRAWPSSRPRPQGPPGAGKVPRHPGRRAQPDARRRSRRPARSTARSASSSSTPIPTSARSSRAPPTATRAS